jgi:hypothetical protein
MQKGQLLLLQLLLLEPAVLLLWLPVTADAASAGCQRVVRVEVAAQCSCSPSQPSCASRRESDMRAVVYRVSATCTAANAPQLDSTVDTGCLLSSATDVCGP